MDKKLVQLVEAAQKALGDRLVSVILYGSGAGADHHQKFSDLNVMCVLTGISAREIADAEPIVRWWRKEGHPSPLLLSEEEVRTSSDVFPIEFHDMLEQRRVLHGRDVIEGLEVERMFYRAQVEHDLRAKLLRLRQKAAAVLTDRDALLRLMLDSVSTFCVLIRHALLLAGVATGTSKREVCSHMREIGISPTPFETLLNIREGATSEKSVTPPALFEEYLAAVGVAVQFVDRLEK